MPRQNSLCVVIADGGHARLVRPAEDNALHTVTAIDATTVHRKDRDLVSDRPGRSFESAAAARHAYAPKHDPHVLEKEKFIQTVARRVSDDASAGMFDELVLVAPSRLLTELSEALDPSAKAKLRGVLAKDLVGKPDHELWPHLKEWVRPVKRA